MVRSRTGAVWLVCVSGTGVMGLIGVVVLGGVGLVPRQGYLHGRSEVLAFRCVLDSFGFFGVFRIKLFGKRVVKNKKYTYYRTVKNIKFQPDSAQ